MRAEGLEFMQRGGGGGWQFEGFTVPKFIPGFHRKPHPKPYVGRERHRACTHAYMHTRTCIYTCTDIQVRVCVRVCANLEGYV